MTTQYTIGDLTRDEWLSLLGIATADDPKLAALAGLSWGGNALKFLQVNATENGWQLSAVAGYTDEQAQDAVGAMIDSTLVYVDGTPLLTRAALAGDVTAAQGSNSVTVTRVNGVALSGLATGILKNTTGTGAPSIAAAGDFPTLNQNTTGSAAKWTTARNLAGNSVDGSANVAFANKFIVQGTTDTGLSGAQFLGALGTGIVKNTTTTGVLSIAVAADFPTLNQNTTGSAATLTTSRNIDGQPFNGSADITVIAPGTHAATTKATPVDADEIPLADSAASFVLKKLTWANLKATLKTYFDTLYQALNSNLTTIAGLTATTDNFIVSVSSAWAARTPAQVKTTLGLGTANSPQFTSIGLGAAPLANTGVYSFGSVNGVMKNLLENTSSGVNAFASQQWKNDAGNIGVIFMNGSANTQYAGGNSLLLSNASNNPLAFGTNDTVRWTISAAGHFLAFADNNYDIGAAGATRPRHVYAAGVIVTGSYTVAGLPAAATAGAGARAFVTDATATTFASTVAGGGANKVPVYSDGANWKIG